MTIQANQGFGVSVFGATGSGGGGTTSPGGSSLQIQYNAAGSFGGMAGTSWDNTNRSLTLTGATVTTSNPVLNLSQTWNAGAVTFKGWVLNVTDTASASASLLMDLQVGGSSKFSVDKTGILTAPRLAWSSSAYSLIANSRITFTEPGGTSPFDIGPHSVGLGAITTVGWWSNNIVGNGSLDLILGRNAAASLRLGAADAAAPVAQTLGVQGVVAGTSNRAGADFTIRGSQSTGDATTNSGGGKIIFQVSPPGTSGTGQNAFANALTITSAQQSLFADGSETVPSISFAGSTNTGIYQSGNQLAFTRAGTLAMYIASNGSLVLSSLSRLDISSNSALVRLGSSSDTILSRANVAYLRYGDADAGATSATVTITIASPGVVTWAGHGLSTGTPVVFTTTGALPTGITAGTTYYVIRVDNNTFQIATSYANALAGTAVNTSGSQSGTQTGTRYAIAQSIGVQGVTGVADREGSNLVINGSAGTGTGAGGSILFRVAPAGGAGSSQNAFATALTISSSGNLTGYGNTFNFGTNGSYWVAQAGGIQYFQLYNNFFSLSKPLSFSTDNDTILTRDAANTLALRNGGTSVSPVPQAFNVYNFWANSGADYERGVAYWTSNAFRILTQAAGAGTARDLYIVSGGNNLRLATGGISTNGWLIDAGGNLTGYTDNTVDIGAAAANRPRTIYASGGVSHASPIIKTTDYSQGANDYSLIFNGAGSITLTLLAAASYPGKILYVKTIAAQTVVSASSNVKPIDTDTAGTAILAATAGKWAMLQSDGTNWVIMAQG